MHNDRTMEFFKGSYYLDRTTAEQAVQYWMGSSSRQAVAQPWYDGNSLAYSRTG